MSTRHEWICSMPWLSFSARSRPDRWMYVIVESVLRGPAKVAVAWIPTTGRAVQWRSRTAPDSPTREVPPLRQQSRQATLWPRPMS